MVLPDIQNIVDEIAYNETKKLLIDLAINFTEKTKRLPVPSGTRVWIFEEFNNELSTLPTRQIRIPLIEFFGMHVGYNSELDILVCWAI